GPAGQGGAAVPLQRQVPPGLAGAQRAGRVVAGSGLGAARRARHGVRAAVRPGALGAAAPAAGAGPRPRARPVHRRAVTGPEQPGGSGGGPERAAGGARAGPGGPGAGSGESGAGPGGPERAAGGPAGGAGAPGGIAAGDRLGRTAMYVGGLLGPMG